MTISNLPLPIPPLAPDVTTLRSQVSAQKGESPAPATKTIAEEDEAAHTKEVESKAAELDKEMIYMGIVTSDSTVVYYKLTKGIKKPADIPDE